MEASVDPERAGEACRGLPSRLRRHLFAGGACEALDPGQAARLSAAARHVRVPVGGSFFLADGDEALSALLLSGTAKLTRLLPDGRTQIVGLVTAPDLLGAPFDGGPTPGAIAATECEALLLGRSVVEAVARENHGFEHRLHLKSLADLREAREHALTLGRRSARERLAWFLLGAWRRHLSQAPEGDGASSVFELPLSRGEIGEFLGLTIETVSRQFTRLRREGVLALPDARSVELRRPERLMEALGSEFEPLPDPCTHASGTPKSWAV